MDVTLFPVPRKFWKRVCTFLACVESDLQVVPLEQVPVLGAVQQEVSMGLFPRLLSVSERPVPLSPAGGPVTAAVPHPVTSNTATHTWTRGAVRATAHWTGTFAWGQTHLLSGHFLPRVSVFTEVLLAHRKLDHGVVTSSRTHENTRSARVLSSVRRVCAGSLDIYCQPECVSVCA